MKIQMKTLKLFILIAAISFSSTFAGNDENRKEKSNAINTSVSLNGVVIDKLTDEALTGVKVELLGTSKSTYTDFEGKFHFERLESGKYQVETSLISYYDKTEDIELETKEGTIEIKLETVN